jgi:hypothetical protein
MVMKKKLDEVISEDKEVREVRSEKLKKRHTSNPSHLLPEISSLKIKEVDVKESARHSTKRIPRWRGQGVENAR